MENRRSQERKYLDYFSRVLDRDSGILIGYLVDLTTGGALIVSNYSLKQNTILDLRIDLPEGFSEQKQLDFIAKIVWVLPDIDPEFYRIGIQLVDIRTSDLTALEHLIINFSNKEH